MATKEHKLYWRVFLYLNKGVIFLSRSMVSKKLDLQYVYDGNLNKIEGQLRKNGILNETDLDVLFPGDGKTNMDKWNANLYLCVIPALFRALLAPKERTKLGVAQNVLKDLLERQGDTKLDKPSYEEHIENIEEAFVVLTFDKSLAIKIVEMKKEYIDEPLDYIKLLKEVEKMVVPSETKQKLVEFLESMATKNTKPSFNVLETTEDLEPTEQDYVQVLQMVGDANSMATELKKGVKFEMISTTPDARGQKDGNLEILIQMIALDGSGNDWMWDRNKFIKRKFLMQEMYQNYIKGDPDWDVPQDKDPFWEPADLEKLIGTTKVLLQSIAYNIDLEERVDIHDNKKNNQGKLDVAIIPCTKEFIPLQEDDFVDDPKELIGKPVYCKIVIKSARGLPSNIDKSFCRYKFYMDQDYTHTKEIAGTINPDFQHEKKITIESVTEQFIDYLNTSSLCIEVLGRQKDIMGKGKAIVAPKLKDKTDEKGGVSSNKHGAPPSTVSDNIVKEMATLNMLKKQAAESDKKLSNIYDYLKKRKAMGHDALMVCLYISFDWL
ncbi:kinesin-like protein KIF13A [Ruditapes philippinarum]|uniref:kinesin-like protein KIF13A n=1 Tax=Ruditapes philippinarum TaxID=129788 RepID=UPI00295C0242|nr:kinesin-like protein KIF13A [Ruditapes philippinarum]